MKSHNLKYILSTLEYALEGPVKDDDIETHFNVYTNAIEVVKNELYEITYPNELESLKNKFSSKQSVLSNALKTELTLFLDWAKSNHYIPLTEAKKEEIINNYLND